MSGHAAKAGAHTKHKKGGHDEEEHENHERWLVSYADMMTLLMVLFIVLFAISQVDQKKFAELKNGLAVGFGSPSVAFEGGEANLLTAGRQIIHSIAPAIATLPNTIEVDGHTNQLGGSTGNYPSGWELSAARAASVIRLLHTDTGIPDTRLQIAGYADTKPRYPTTDPRAATLNRRVEIIVLSSLPAGTRALLPSASTN